MVQWGDLLMRAECSLALGHFGILGQDWADQGAGCLCHVLLGFHTQTSMSEGVGLGLSVESPES